MKYPTSIPSPKKRKQSDSQQNDPTLAVVDTDERQEKRKKKCRREEKEIDVSAPAAFHTDINIKKKKKRKENKEQEEEVVHDIVEDSVTETKKKKKKKKQKEILCEESVDAETADQQDVESDCVLLGITPGKKKKKQGQDEEQIHHVPEESVMETTDQHAGETDPGSSLGINGRKKKKKKKGQGEEEIISVTEESGSEIKKKKKKQKQTLCEESVDTDTADRQGGEIDSGLMGINIVKKKKKRKEREMHNVKEDSVNEVIDLTLLAETNHVKKKRKLEQENEEVHAAEDDSAVKMVPETNGKKKKKKRRRTQEQEGEEIHHAVEEDSGIENVTETTDSQAGATSLEVLAETNSVKKKKKKKRRKEEDEGIHHAVGEDSAIENVTETTDSQAVATNLEVLPETNSVKKKKKKKRREDDGIHHAVEEDSAIENVTETTDSQAGATNLEVLPETSSVKKKKKKKKRREDEGIHHAVEEDSAIENVTETTDSQAGATNLEVLPETNSVVKKKKKKRRKEEDEEIHHAVEEDSVIENVTETTDSQAGATNHAVLPETNSVKKKKEKKRRTQEQGGEKIHHAVEEDSAIENVTETTDSQAGATNLEVLPETNSVKKKKEKKRRKEEDEQIPHAVEEDSVIEIVTETTDSQAGATNLEVLPETRSVKKKKEKKRRTQEQGGEEIHHAVEEDSAIESVTETTDSQAGATNHAVLPETNSVKKKRRKEEDEGIHHAVEEDSAIENVTETTDSQAGATNLEVLPETRSVKKKKEKKRRTQEQGGEEIHHAVEEDSAIESVTETTDNQAGATNHAVLPETYGVKTRRRAKEVQEEEEMHAEDHQSNTEPLVSGGAQMEAKKSSSKTRTKKVVRNVKAKVTPGNKEGGKTLWGRRTGQRSVDADDVFNSKLLDEMQEFIPGVRRLGDIQIRRLLRHDLPRFREFKKQGISVRKGQFTEEDNQRIRKNVADFQALVGISSVEKIVFPERFKDEEKEIRRLKRQHCYKLCTAEGVPRTCDQVKMRVRKIFDEQNRKGKFSDEELKTLVKLQKLHGNNWKKISESMDRSGYALEKRFNSYCKGYGAWKADEVSRLTKALRDYMENLLQQDPESSGLSRDQLCDNLPWKEICQKVDTRNWLQCRLKWFSLLKTKLGTTGQSAFKRGAKARRAKIQLIKTLHDMAVDDQAEVDWHGIARAIGAATPVCIQKTFLRLKATYVPHWSNLSFGEIVDFLHEVVLPKLKANIFDKEEEPPQQQQEEEQERMYQLSDIFGPENGEEFVELNNS